MNKVLATGRFTDDPKITSTKDGLCIARFNIALNRRTKDGGADFPSCVAFGKTAEHIEKYYHKGMKADIVGRIQTGSYENKDGKKVYTTDVVIEEIEFGESKASQTAVAPKESTDFENVPDEIDEELPFN